MCDATFDIILLWSVTKKLREPHGKSNHITATRMMQFHVHQTSWSQRTKKPLAINFLKRGANSRPQSMDGIYSPLQILLFFVFFSCSWTQCVASHKLQLWLCAVLAVELAARRVWRRSLCNHLQENTFSNHTSSAHTAQGRRQQ